MYMSQVRKVRLRAMEPEDLDSLYEMENQSEQWDQGVTNVPYSRYALYNYVSECKNDIYADRQLRLMVVSEDDTCVGIVDLVEFDPKHLRAELGLVIKKEYRNQGYGKAAVVEMLRYSRDIIHLHQVYVIISDDNVQSRKLFHGLGFTGALVLKDWLYTKGSWRDAVLLQFFNKKESDCLEV
ncbi:GNAT family N-acetyltransferase [Segatella baroniae]|uniref:GNAT family N-acetyltransferase n=2 Tax=Segatella baroniae TaxID=305719 RepID=UPI0005677CDA|nr:GNAT family N-acetyltransferase [Segatella baroniae]